MTNLNSLHLTAGTEFTHELGFDPDWGVFVDVKVEIDADDEEFADRVQLEELVEALQAEQRQALDYQGMYCTAHELRRLSEELYQEARGLEQSDDAIIARFSGPTGGLG